MKPATKTAEPAETPALDFERRRRPPWRGCGRSFGRGAARLLAWAPVWLPALVTVQLTLLGALPAWREARKLERDTLEVDARIEGLQAERLEFERQAARLADPVFRERVRRRRSELGPDLLLPATARR